MRNKKVYFFFPLVFLFMTGILKSQEGLAPITVEPTIIKSGYDRDTCWTQANAGVIPGYGAILTSQKSALLRSDDYSTINFAVSKDDGTTWTDFTPIPSFERQKSTKGDWEFIPADSAPIWHACSQKLLFLGNRIWYRGEDLWRQEMDTKTESNSRPDSYVSSNTWYTTYNVETESVEPIKYLMVPKESAAVTGRFGCAQRWDLPDGTILIPVYAKDKENKGRHCVVVIHCSFDGHDLVYLNEGRPIRLNQHRGMMEPQLVRYKEKFYISLRNDERAYLAVSDDGMNFSEPKPWVWKETGDEIGSYNTQQHWARVGDRLLLVYTRRGANNDHIIRNRAPLFAALFCPETETLIKSTETIVVPERGAPLGNFGIAQVAPNEAWVLVAEDMQSLRFPAPDQHLDCEKHGSNNAIWLTKLRINEEKAGETNGRGRPAGPDPN